MNAYRVSFFNHLVNDQGKCCKVLQRVVRIDDAIDLADAMSRAERRFEELECVPDWRLHAGVVEAQLVEGETTA